jgi:hypothetical protein
MSARLAGVGLQQAVHAGTFANGAQQCQQRGGAGADEQPAVAAHRLTDAGGSAPTCWPFAVARASRSSRARPPLPTHSVAGLGPPVSIGDVDVATEADDVIEAKRTKEGEQLLIAEAAISQYGDAAPRRYEFG